MGSSPELFAFEFRVYESRCIGTHIVRGLWPLHVNRLLHLLLDFDPLLVALDPREAQVCVRLGRRHFHGDVYRLHNEDSLLHHRLAPIFLLLLLSKSLELGRADNFVRNGALVVNLLHHVEELSGRDLFALVVRLGYVDAGRAESVSAVEVLVRFDVDLLPVETGVVEVVRVLARSLLLGLNLALGELETILWLCS